MTRSRRLPALTRRWKTVAARLAPHWADARPHSGALLHTDGPLGPDDPLRPIVGRTGREAFVGEGLGEDVLHLVVAVDDKDPLGLGRKGVDPRQQAVFVRVAGQTGQLADLRPHLDGLTEQFDIGSTFNEGAAQCADG